jgi:hypothetical protein
VIVGLALALAAQAGLTFDCRGVGSFEVFVPADKARAGYSTTAFQVMHASRDEGPQAEVTGFEDIRDELPAQLVMTWRREHNSPVTLTITGYDAAAGTARYTLSAELNPASRLFTPVTTRGTCKARAEVAG